jgi:FixJ family two-component response regulator
LRRKGIDGIEVLKRIKALDDKAQIIVLTSHGDKEMAALALQYGASAFIAKPIRDEDLMQELEKAKNRSEPGSPLARFCEG